jgi:hypothetical protein
MPLFALKSERKASALRSTPTKGVLIAGYLVAYVVVDWISDIHVLEPLGITPWNPPPGLSLALLLSLGLRYAPFLFVAALVAEVIVRGIPASLAYTALSSAVIATGYTLASAILLVTSSLLANWDKKGGDDEQFLRGFNWDGKQLTPAL